MENLSKAEVAFKKKIRALREEKYLSKLAVSKGSGIDYSYYHRMENMNKSMYLSFRTLEALADFYKTDVSELFKEPHS